MDWNLTPSEQLKMQLGESFVDDGPEIGVEFDPLPLDAFEGQNIRQFVKDGFIIRKSTKIHSRSRARRLAEAKSKGRHSGYVRCHLSEDPKTLKVFPIPLHDPKGETLHYDRLSISPDGKILAATHDSLLQRPGADTGKVVDTADKAHDVSKSLRTSARRYYKNRVRLRDRNRSYGHFGGHFGNSIVKEDLEDDEAEANADADETVF